MKTHELPKECLDLYVEVMKEQVVSGVKGAVAGRRYSGTTRSVDTLKYEECGERFAAFKQ